MKIIILGSGSIIPTSSRFSSSILLENDDLRVLMDVGPGTIEKLRKLKIDPNTIGVLLITHFHLDHVLDLPALLKIRLFNEVGGANPSPPQLELIGPVGLRDFLENMVSDRGVYSYLSQMMRYDVYVNLYEVGGGLAYDSRRLKVYALPVEHFNGLAYRVEFDGYSIAYSGDTVYDENIVKLAEDVDVLIHECSFPSEMILGKHSSEKDLLRVVRKAKPKILIVTHLYPAWESREKELEELFSKEPIRRVIIPKDMDIIEV
ncbi:MAG: MBL fold metallo-hydrolase [Nitrososphaerota archaeon]